MSVCLWVRVCVCGWGSPIHRLEQTCKSLSSYEKVTTGGLQIGATTMQNSMEINDEIKTRTTL